MKKAISIFLTVVLLSLSIISFNACNSTKHQKTIIGEITYVKSFYSHCIYVKPLGCEDEGEVWVPISVSDKTATLSGFSENIADMPELAIGSIVEIVYSTKDPRGKHVLFSSYEAISIRTYESTEAPQKQELPFIATENYYYGKDATSGNREIGTVVHIAKLHTPLNGYIIYLEGDYSQSLITYWIDEDALHKETGGITASDEVKNLLESFATGYKVKITGLGSYPFGKFNMQPIDAISLYND